MARGTFVVACGLTALTFVAAISAQQTPAPAETTTAAEQTHDEKADTALLEMVCGACHESALVAGPLRTPAEWDEAIDRMQSYGASATPGQYQQIRAHLLRTYGRANVNTAAAKDLVPVLDVTAMVADAVVTHRQQHGPFKTLDDLKQVPGLDAAKVDARKARFTF